MTRDNIVCIMPRDPRDKYSHLRWGEEKSERANVRITPTAAKWLSDQPAGYLPYLIESLARGKAVVVEVDPTKKEHTLRLSEKALEAYKKLDLEYILEEYADGRILITYRDPRITGGYTEESI